MLHPTPLTLIALTATSLVGDLKAEAYFESATECMQEARRLMDAPDTYVYLYNTSNDGERTAQPFAVISLESGYTSLV